MPCSCTANTAQCTLMHCSHRNMHKTYNTTCTTCTSCLACSSTTHALCFGLSAHVCAVTDLQSPSVSQRLHSPEAHARPQLCGVSITSSYHLRCIACACVSAILTQQCRSALFFCLSVALLPHVGDSMTSPASYAEATRASHHVNGSRSRTTRHNVCS